jgi:hypothetical protein
MALKRKRCGVSLLRRILAFAGLSFLSLITPFLFLPILARVAGAEAWLAIAIGQSIGAFAALVVALGYNTIGPTTVALEPAPTRPAILERSIRPRLALFVPASAVAATLAALVAPGDYRLDTALMAVVLTMSGLSSSWYMIGLGFGHCRVGDRWYSHLEGIRTWPDTARLHASRVDRDLSWCATRVHAERYRGAVGGVPVVLELLAAYGAAGGAWGLVLAEAVSITCQAVFAARRWPKASQVP